MQGKFLCGCAPSEKRKYSGDTIRSKIFGADPIYTDKRHDAQGFEVCPEHGERMYGWKSDDPSSPHYVGNGQGMPPTFVSPGRSSVTIHESEFPDRRDNRDPQEVHREMTMAGVIEIAPTNGHTVPAKEILDALDELPQ